jgi:hypothetical protein
MAEAIVWSRTVLARALDAADTGLAAAHVGVDEWYPGLYTDHLYLACPALKKTEPQPRRGAGRLYPEAGDVCGWCLRIWRARNPALGTPEETK